MSLSLRHRDILRPSVASRAQKGCGLPLGLTVPRASFSLTAPKFQGPAARPQGHCNLSAWTHYVSELGVGERITVTVLPASHSVVLQSKQRPLQLCPHRDHGHDDFPRLPLGMGQQWSLGETREESIFMGIFARNIRGGSGQLLISPRKVVEGGPVGLKLQASSACPLSCQTSLTKHKSKVNIIKNF